MARENRQLVAKRAIILFPLEIETWLSTAWKEEIDIVLVEEKVLRENSFLLSFIRQSFPDMIIIALGESNDSFPLELFLKACMIIFLFLLLLRILSVIKSGGESFTENKDLKKSD